MFESSLVMSNEDLAMLRALVEDEELAESYAVGNKSILGIHSDLLPLDLVSDYLDEINLEELAGSTKDADATINAAHDLPLREKSK